MRSQVYIVATIKSWNITQFKSVISRYPGRWILITDPKKLTPAFVRRVKPKYIFFPHWSWKVSNDILHLADCVCFHETDVPYGRGGSPIQNLIARGHRSTKISALRMEDGMDTGPIYMKRPLSLTGSASDIFMRASRIVARMIKEIAAREIMPRPQKGTPVIFKRRTPQESDLTLIQGGNIKKVFDHIRMLDAESYPRAYIALPGLRLEFTNARLLKNHVKAEVHIWNV